MKLTALAVSPLLLLLASPAFPKQPRPSAPRITGTYSNMRYVEEAGDVVGMEILVVDGGDGYYAVVQIAEGVPTPPVVAKVQVKGSHIEFNLSPGTGVGSGKYVGRVAAGGLRGKFEGEAKASWLQRKRSYWR